MPMGATDAPALKSLGLPSFELTALGEHQCFLLGQSIRQRYVGDESQPSPSRLRGELPLSHYDSEFHAFYSTDESRTARSAWSVATGIFDGQSIEIPASGNDTAAVEVPALRGNTQSVRLRVGDDRFTREYDICPVAFNISTYVWEDLGKQVDIKKDLKRMSKLLKVKLRTLSDFYHRFDTLVVLEAHGGMSDEMKGKMPELKAFMDRIWWRRFQLSSNPPVDAAVGSTWLKATKNAMVSASASVGASSDQKGHYSHVVGHDSGVSVLLGALGVASSLPAPEYGAALALEMLKLDGDGEDDDEGFGVRIAYKGSFGQEDWSILRLAAHEPCKEKDVCPLDDFKSFIDSLNVLEDDRWCAICDPLGKFSTCELAASRTRLGVLQSEYDTATTNVDNLAKQIKTLKDHAAELKAAYEEARDKCDSAVQADLDAAKKDLKAMTEKRDTLKKQTEILNEELGAKEKEVGTVTAELATFKDHLAEVEKSRETCGSDLKEANARIVELVRNQPNLLTRYGVYVVFGLLVMTLLCLAFMCFCFCRLRRKHQTVVDYQRVRIELSSSDEDFDDVDLLANM